jgi:hypothetical protein
MGLTQNEIESNIDKPLTEHWKTIQTPDGAITTHQGADVPCGCTYTKPHPKVDDFEAHSWCSDQHRVLYIEIDDA